jgi:hypothetical protein
MVKLDCGLDLVSCFSWIECEKKKKKKTGFQERILCISHHLNHVIKVNISTNKLNLYQVSLIYNKNNTFGNILSKIHTSVKSCKSIKEVQNERHSTQCLASIQKYQGYEQQGRVRNHHKQKITVMQ